MPKPHDLLKLDDSSLLVLPPDAPAWVAASLLQAPYVVVRRTAPTQTHLPVGIRGASRAERQAAWLPLGARMTVLAPEELVGKLQRLSTARLSLIPALQALVRLPGVLRHTGLAWGPVGSAGFELATGVQVMTPTSDIDLLLRVPAGLTRTEANELLTLLAVFPPQMDVQLEGPLGTVNLREYAQGPAEVMLRTLDGSQLTARPWGHPA